MTWCNDPQVLNLLCKAYFQAKTFFKWNILLVRCRLVLKMINLFIHDTKKCTLDSYKYNLTLLLHV
jgi:hypothetical protein